jgi:hypothetical protein
VDAMVGVGVACSVGAEVGVDVTVGAEVGERSAPTVGVDWDWPEGWKVTSWGGLKK